MPDLLSTPEPAMSLSEKRIRFFGKWIATPTFAIGSSITTTVATASIGFISGLGLPWMILVLALVFLAEALVSTYFFKNAVPDTLAACFIQNVFRNLSTIKKSLLSLGILAAIGSGIAFGALTYISSASAMATILGLFSLSCPPLGIVFASVLCASSVFCITCLFIKHIELAIRNDFHLKVLQFFKQNFSRDHEKHLMQQVLEVFFKLFFIAVILMMTFIGMVAFLGTMQGGLLKFLSLIPNANALAVSISSSIIAYGLMGVARLPWILNTSCSIMSMFGEYIGKKLYQLGACMGLCRPSLPEEPKPASDKKPQDNGSWKAMMVSFLQMSAVAIHGFCYGALARSGGGHIVTEMMGKMGISSATIDLGLVGETAALLGQGGVQAAVSAHAFFAKPPKKMEEQERPDDTSRPS